MRQCTYHILSWVRFDRSGVDECVAALLKVRSNVTTVTDDYRSLAHKKIFYGEKAA